MLPPPLKPRRLCHIFHLFPFLFIVPPPRAHRVVIIQVEHPVGLQSNPDARMLQNKGNQMVFRKSPIKFLHTIYQKMRFEGPLNILFYHKDIAFILTQIWLKTKKFMMIT